MRKTILLLNLMTVLLFCTSESFSTTVLDFEDLLGGEFISGSNYAGLTWEYGSQGFLGQNGDWMVSSTDYLPRTSYPHSGKNLLINGNGTTLTGIQFPNPVNVIGAYIAGQASSSGWTTQVRVHGFLNGEPVGMYTDLSGNKTAVTDWFTDIDSHPDWFQIDLFNVDRIVFECTPVWDGAGWFGLDDLTYETIPEPATLSLLALGAFLAGRKKKK